MAKVDAAKLKLIAQNYGLNEVRQAAIELEHLRNQIGLKKNVIKKKNHVIRTIDHHNDRLNNDNVAKTSVLEKFREENKRLREALEFYADEKNYYAPVNWPYSSVMADEGEKARKALEGEQNA